MLGGVFFQAILLQDDFFDNSEKNEATKVRHAHGGKGSRIAEGGRYDDLVRQFRPPGNFGSIQLDSYTGARVPCCIGVRLRQTLGTVSGHLYLSLHSGKHYCSNLGYSDLFYCNHSQEVHLDDPNCYLSSRSTWQPCSYLCLHHLWHP